jgi:hypothetical protein
MAFASRLKFLFTKDDCAPGEGNYLQATQKILQVQQKKVAARGGELDKYSESAPAARE